MVGVNKRPPDRWEMGWFLPASCKDLVWLCVCLGGVVVVAVAAQLWSFVLLSSLPLCLCLLHLRRWVRGDLYRRVPVGIVQFSCSVAGASSWISVQEQGPWREGGGSGGYSRWLRWVWPTPGPELLGGDPRSMLPMVRNSVGGAVLRRLVKTGHAVSSPRGGAAAMVSVELEDLQGPICNFSFS
jgi:hypothetical protein